MYNFYDAAILQNTQSRTNQHTQTVRYTCTKCDSLFTARIYLHHHEAAVHNRVFHCPFCEALFSNKPDYATHVNAHTEKRFLPCAFCRKVFDDRDEYNMHVKLHTERFLYKCDKCSAMFSQLSKLRTHKATHVNRKFIHTIPKFSKRRTVCSCKSPSDDDSSNPASSNAGSATAPAASATAACQTEAPSGPCPSGPEDSEPDSSGDPEAGFSGSRESKENSPQRSSSTSHRKRKKKAEREERRPKKMKKSNGLARAVKKCVEIASQRLSVADIERPPEGNQIPSTSGQRVTRQRGLRLQNKEAAERITDTVSRELSEAVTEATSATEKPTSSNSELVNTLSKQGAGRSRRNKRNNAATVTEAEAGGLSEDNIEIIRAPGTQISSSSRKIRRFEDQETDAGTSTSRKRVTTRSESERIRKKRGSLPKNKNEPTKFLRPRRNRLQIYQNAGSANETEAARSEENIEITSTAETQISVPAQVRFGDQETNAEITSADNKQVSSVSKNKKIGKKRGRPLQNKKQPVQLARVLRNRGKYQNGGTMTETVAKRSSRNRLEPNSQPAEAISSALEEPLATIDERDDVEVDSATQRQPLSTLNDQNVALQAARNHSPEAPEQTLETNSNQLTNEDVEVISIIDESISLSSPEEIQESAELTSFIDLTSSSEPSPAAIAIEDDLETGEVTVSNGKKLSSPKKLAKVQKPKSLSTKQKLAQDTSAPSVSVIRKITVPLSRSQLISSTLSKVPISRVTVLRPVTASKTSVELSRANEVASSVSQPSTANQTVFRPVIASQTSVVPRGTNEVTSSVSQPFTANQPETMRRKYKPIYQSFGGETSKSTNTAAKSLTSKGSATDSRNADSVYTFEEENFNKNISSGAESSSTNKRRHSELWRFFITTPQSPMKKTKKAKLTKRRKSVLFYQCSYCTREFPNHDLASKHELVHAKNEGFACDLCGGVFGGRGNLKSHQKLVHNPTF